MVGIQVLKGGAIKKEKRNKMNVGAMMKQEEWMLNLFGAIASLRKIKDGEGSRTKTRDGVISNKQVFVSQVLRKETLILMLASNVMKKGINQGNVLM